MKKLLLTLFISTLFIQIGRSQPCAANCTLYTLSSITPNMIPAAGTAVSLSDDQVSGGLPIGFTFTFYCNAYNTFYISSNGFISFNPSVSQGCCSGAVIPSVGNAVNNMIAFDWNDLYPPGAGNIRYQTVGVAPNRTLLVTYTGIPHCCNNGPNFNTGQIKLFETSNIIEIHSGVITTDGSSATQGIMNAAGTIAVPVPGRNGVTWTATSDAYRFTPALGGPTAPGPILGNLSICPGAPTVYSVTPMVGATSYAWTLPGGWSGSSTTNTILATPGATGVLSVTATYTCGTSPVVTVNVVVNPTPTISITGGPTSICPGNTVNLTGNGGSTYTWNPGNIVGTSIAVTPTTSTTYTVIGAGAGGCTATAVQPITVNPSPTVTISGTNQICMGNVVSLVANGAASYTWNTGSLLPNITPSPTTTTTYSVIGTTGTCPGTAAITVTVNPIPVITIAGNNTVCAGSPINLLAGGANSYTWSTGALTATIAPSPTANTTYTVYGSNTLTGCSSSAVHSVTVNAIPTLSMTGPNAMCINQTITLTGYGATTYSWSTAQTTQSIQVSPPLGTNNFTLTGFSTLGCASVPLVKTVTVNPIPVVNITGTETLICKGFNATLTASGVNTYSWNTGALTPTIVISPSITTTYSVTGTNTTTGCYTTVVITINVSPCTGITSLASTSATELTIYPNPNNGEFTVEYKNGKNKDIEVYDMMGRSIISTSSEEDKITVNIKEFANGIYYVKIQSEDMMRVVKVVKQ